MDRQQRKNQIKYFRQENRERFVIVQIEDPEPMQDLDRIAQVEGIGMLFFGPDDFARASETRTNSPIPRIAETRRQVANVARRYGKFAGTITTIDSRAETVAMGYRFAKSLSRSRWPQEVFVGQGVALG